VGEELQRQTVMLVSAIKDVLDAVSKNMGRRCLVRRKTDLETALESYERACVSLQQVADPDACAAATKARRTLVDSGDEALDQLETIIEVKAEDKVSDTEVKLKEEKLEEIGDKDDIEFCAKDWVRMGAYKHLDPGEGAGEGMKVKQDLGEVLKVEVTCVDEDEECAAKDELQEPRIPKSNHEEGFTNEGKVFSSGGLDPGIWGSGEGDAKGWKKAMKELKVEVNQEPSKELRRRFPQLFGFISHDAKVDLQEEFDAAFELQVPEIEPRRFVTAGCRGQSTNSEYG